MRRAQHSPFLNRSDAMHSIESRAPGSMRSSLIPPHGPRRSPAGARSSSPDRSVRRPAHHQIGGMHGQFSIQRNMSSPFGWGIRAAKPPSGSTVWKDRQRLRARSSRGSSREVRLNPSSLRRESNAGRSVPSPDTLSVKTALRKTSNRSAQKIHPFRPAIFMWPAGSTRQADSSPAPVRRRREGAAASSSSYRNDSTSGNSIKGSPAHRL